MSSYAVDFWKSVSNEDGQSHETCEARLHVEASSPDEARKRAEAMFCESRMLAHWSESADRVEIEEQNRPTTPLSAQGAEGDAEQPWSHVDT